MCEIPKIWAALDPQSRQDLGTACKPLQVQRRKHTLYMYISAPTIRNSRAFARHISTTQPALRVIDMSSYYMSAQDLEILSTHEWPKLRVLQLNLCTSTMEDCCSGISALADGYWPALRQLRINHMMVPHFFSHSGEAAIRLFLRGRFPDLCLHLSSTLWRSKDEQCTASADRMLWGAAPGDEYRDMLQQSAVK